MASQRIVPPVVSTLKFDFGHNGAANFASRRFPLTFTDTIMIEHAATAKTMRSFAVFVSACFHVAPQRDHLTAELRRARRPSLALACMTQQKKTLLLLHNHAFLLCRFRILILRCVGIVGVDNFSTLGTRRKRGVPLRSIQKRVMKACCGGVLRSCTGRKTLLSRTGRGQKTR